MAVHPVRPGDRWRDLSVRHTLRASLRSGRSGWQAEDLRSVTRRHDTIYDVVVVLDVSASMGRAERPVVAPAATALVEAMVRAGMRVGAVVFSEEALVARRLSRATVPFPAEGYAFADATNIEGGIDAGRLLLRREGVPGARPHVVLVTDAETTSHSGSDEAWGRAGAPSGLSGLSRLLSGGMTEAARRGALLAAGRCRRAGVTVSVVYPDRRADVAFAHALAAAGGGAARCLCS